MLLLLTPKYAIITPKYAIITCPQICYYYLHHCFMLLKKTSMPHAMRTCHGYKAITKCSSNTTARKKLGVEKNWLVSGAEHKKNTLTV